MNVEDMLGALRAADSDGGDGGDDADLAAATQLRVMRSIERRVRGRHQLAGLGTALAILLAGTVSWALATGHIAALWSPRVEIAPEPAPAPASPPRRPPQRIAVPPPAPAALPEPPAEVAEPPAPPVPDADAIPHPETAPPPRPTPRPAPRPSAPAPEPVEQLYRRAHELHFHGGSPAAALAAWDAYLAAEPAGRFSLEARYNRALMLIRLRRYAEARAALAPFARGDVSPAGYRQAEAEQLFQRLAQYE